jgi:hypothetical protein
MLRVIAGKFPKCDKKKEKDIPSLSQPVVLIGDDTMCCTYTCPKDQRL